MYIGVLIGSLNTIFIFPNILTEEEYGLTRILMSASSVVSQFALLGTGNILVRFHPHFKDDKFNTTLSLGFIITVTGLVLAALFLLFFKPLIIGQYEENSPLFTDYYYLILPFVASLMFFSLFDGYLRVIIKNSFPAFLNFILLRILWLVLVLIYGFGYFSLTTFVNVYVGCQAIIAVLAFIYVIYLGKLNLSFHFSTERLKLMRKMMSFGIFTIISGLSFFLINKIDILMVGKYIGLEQVAIYTIAFYMTTVITIPAQSISRTAQVLVANAFKDNQLKSINGIYKLTAINQLLLGGYVYIIIMVNYHSIITFLPDAYHDSFSVFVLLGMAKIIDSGFGVNSAIILNSKYFRFDTISSLILLALTVFTNIYFIPIYGIEGAAFATALSTISFNLVKYIFLRFKMNMSPFSKEYFLSVLVLIICFLTAYYFPRIKLVWLDIFIRGGIVSILFTVAILYLNVSPHVKKILTDILEKLNIRI